MRPTLGWMPNWLLCCVILVSVPTHAQQTDEQPDNPPPGDAPATQYITRTLGSLGHYQGLQQITAEGSVAFNMPMPLDAQVSEPRLELHYSPAAWLGPDASLQVLINGTPRENIGVADISEDATSPSTENGAMAETRMLSVPLQQEDLRLPYLQVRVRARSNVPMDRCTSPRAQQTYLTIEPETAIAYQLDQGPAPSVRGYINTLPHDVRIAISQPAPDPEALRAAWLLTHELQERGHDVEHTGLENGADIVIASRRELAQTGVRLAAGHNIDVVVPDPQQPTSRLLAVTEPFYIDALADPWGALLTSSGYPESISSPAPTPSKDSVQLIQLGVDGNARPFADRAEWAIDTNALPAGRLPTALNLNLVVPPSPAEQPLTLYVMQDNMLRAVQQLSPDGGPQSVRVGLNEVNPTASEPIRVLLIRPGAECIAAPPSGYAQLLTSSAVETRPAGGQSQSVAAFGYELADRYFVHLPPDALGRPHEWISVLASLGRSLALDPRMAEFVSTSMAPGGSRPFIWLGSQPPEGFDASIAVDQGRVRIRDNEGRILLDSGELPGTSFASLLRSGSQRGIWLRALDDGLPKVPPGLEQSTGDLVFGDERGVLVSLDTRDYALMKVEYPDYSTWWERLARYRGLLFVIGWVVLTLVAIVVSRRIRKKS
ncbi:cellulose biosynthesis cyclic di-GMP-binding regulatory protein BcsB [Pseudomonas sp. OIL-1]|uniref:cellulose biosynthesis cyclic di-GMP-binding regulatory protein BcsB n=1 Tax=Pseudomonas sp. OIL-1 TaxID=2706126 RepID=UPI001C499C6D|nr:cellulose biosynthesis cyclic di-GMP-binding regulatory protein BcsB [Pseudomonas sp. OIL-1]